MRERKRDRVTQVGLEREERGIESHWLGQREEGQSHTGWVRGKRDKVTLVGSERRVTKSHWLGQREE